MPQVAVNAQLFKPDLDFLTRLKRSFAPSGLATKLGS
jgi:hypothetical protein